jgi:hypothetical protein
MPGLVPGIHDFPSEENKQDVDGRDKPGHDGFQLDAPVPAATPRATKNPLARAGRSKIQL